MGLDDDIYAVLNADWSVPIISKPTFHKNEQDPTPEPRHIFINAPELGDFIEDSSDNSMDSKLQKFILTIYEANEDEVVKSIRASKKALHEKNVSSGYYHIDSFEISEENQIVTATLLGRLVKQIGVDEF